jgi:hypothetical protein
MEPAAIFVSKRLKTYVDEKYDGNVNRACYHMGIKNYSGAYRLYNGTATSVHFFLASRILKHTDPENYFQILADFFPDDADEVLSIKTNAEKDIIEEVEKKFALGVSSRTHFSIFARSLEHDGLTLDDITRDFGREGLQVADELRSAGVLCLESGTLRGVFADKDVRPSIQSVRQHGHLHVDLFEEAPGFRMENPFGGLNEAGLQKVYGMIDSFIPEVLSVFRKPEYKGNVMYLVTILGGLMSQPGNKEQGQ